jgi:hypothetical protein
VEEVRKFGSMVAAAGWMRGWPQDFSFGTRPEIHLVRKG